MTQNYGLIVQQPFLTEFLWKSYIASTRKYIYKKDYILEIVYHFIIVVYFLIYWVLQGYDYYYTFSILLVGKL